MEPSIRQPKRSMQKSTEALVVFVVTAVILVLIIAAFQFYVFSGKEQFPLSTGDFVEYRVEGKLSNISIGGEFIFYFTENNNRGLDQFIVTISPSSGIQQGFPFVEKPLLDSQYFHYDGKNLYAMGSLLALASSHYDGSNHTGLTTDSFGSFMDYHNFQRVELSYSNGKTIHYVDSANGTPMGQWVVNGTGLPVKITYADGYGTDISLTFAYTNIDWIKRLPIQ